MNNGMGNELQRSIDTLLEGSTSKTALSIRLLAQMVDSKFTQQDEQSTLRHQEILEAIFKNKKETDKALEGIEVVRFFSSHPKAFWIVVACILVMVGAGAENIWKTFLK